MDLMEKVFGRASAWLKRKDAERERAYAVEFDDVFPSLVAVAQGAVSSRGVRLQLKGYGGFGALYEDTLLLPDRIAVTQTKALNRDVFLHKAIAGGVLRANGIMTVAKASSWPQRSFQIGILREYVRKQARVAYPRYALWAEALDNRLAAEPESPGISGADRAWLRIESRLKREISEAAEAVASSGRLDRITLEKLERAIPAELVRELDELPGTALALWCEPGLARTALDGNAADPKAGKREQKPGSDVERRAPTEIEVVDLEAEKKKDNPVTHSFEKLETADDYQGGYKGADGSDELQEHANALEEVEMKKVTRGGEASSSTYRADISDLVHSPESAAAAPTAEIFRAYPEWDYRSGKMILDHCRLYLEAPTPRVRTSSEPDWKEDVLGRHAQGLEEWKHRLSMLVNERRVRDRQWEGTDISIDAFVRYVGDARHSGSGDARLYTKSFAGIRDFSCLILVDQSYSTDSWVLNRRVLDVELESLALVSELLSPLREPVAVAGTWSETRNHCHFITYKGFDDPWQRFTDHAPAIEPRGYTRLGPAIRHATRLLSDRGGKHKLLILLTDGKPTDHDRYEGRYGIEDIHHACLEAAQVGVSVRALAVEKEAKNYFPYLFGPRDYQILQNPDELPERLFRIYLESIRR